MGKESLRWRANIRPLSRSGYCPGSLSSLTILLQHKTQISRRAACETVVSARSFHRGEFFHPSPQEPRALSLNQLGLAIVIEVQGLNHIVGDVGLGQQREPRVF